MATSTLRAQLHASEVRAHVLEQAVLFESDSVSAHRVHGGTYTWRAYQLTRPVHGGCIIGTFTPANGGNPILVHAEYADVTEELHLKHLEWSTLIGLTAALQEFARMRTSLQRRRRHSA